MQLPKRAELQTGDKPVESWVVLWAEGKTAFIFRFQHDNEVGFPNENAKSTVAYEANN